jgi:hypothetical protein
MTEAPTLRQLVLAQLRTYVRESRGPSAKSIAAAMSTPTAWQDVLAELKGLDAEHLVRGRKMSGTGALHWQLTDRGRREVNET